jgi:hypothetical protein
MILALKVGMRVMLNNDRLGNTQVLDSSQSSVQLASSCSESYDSARLQRHLPFRGDRELPALSP